MSRLDQLPGNRLVAMLDTIERDLTELKTTAQTVSTANVGFSISDSGDAYDWTGVLVSEPGGSVGFGYRTLIVTATSDTQNVNFGDVIATLATGSPANLRTYPMAVADQRAGHALNYFTGSATAPATDVGAPAIDTGTATGGGTAKQWALRLFGDLTTTFYVKCYVVANDQVTVTAAAV